jgi:hypothetical protein
VYLSAAANLPTTDLLSGLQGVPGARVTAVAPVARGAGQGGWHRPVDGGDWAVGPPCLQAPQTPSPPPTWAGRGPGASSKSNYVSRNHFFAPFVYYN